MLIFIIMDNELNRDCFTKKDFNSKDFLNKLFASKPEGNILDTESEILSFKLKIIQREFSNEIDLSTNNLIKSAKTLHTDLGTIKLLNDNLLGKVTSLEDLQMSNRNLVDLEKVVEVQKANRNLNYSLKYI